MSGIGDFFKKKKTIHIDVPETLPDNDGKNPNEPALKKNRRSEVPKVYGPAQPQRVDRDQIAVVYGPAPGFTSGQNDKPPVIKSRRDFTAVYGPAERFKPKPTKDAVDEKPEDLEDPDAE